MELCFKLIVLCLYEIIQPPPRTTPLHFSVATSATFTVFQFLILVSKLQNRSMLGSLQLQRLCSINSCHAGQHLKDLCVDYFRDEKSILYYLVKQNISNLICAGWLARALRMRASCLGLLSRRYNSLTRTNKNDIFSTELRNFSILVPLWS